MIHENHYVTKTFLPPLEEYEKYLQKIWEKGQLTNQGPLVSEFEDKLRKRLELENVQFVANGTLALQLAIRALDIEPGSEIITTPFTYVATTSAVLWEGCVPVYADIDDETLCIDPVKIEKAITKKTKAIMPVHVFGHLCEIEKIDAIAKKHKLKVIYDAAHAFGVKYKGKAALSFGDVSTCSFHATKLFHTIEGGLIVSADSHVDGKVDLMKRFGHTGDEHYLLGINAKASEFQAAMGLTNLRYIDEIIAKRKLASHMYDQLLGPADVIPMGPNLNIDYNYAYYPVLFRSETALKRVLVALAERKIFPRRYFYPSLNTLSYTGGVKCPISEDISSRIACLPLYADIKESIIKEISEIIYETQAPKTSA